ncbi:hypothetical protein [Amycolatopsis sp. cg9]|uniref:hypothetical protein n=1 Tax=Amycolatopsis sp. cg9 TaxID=3238801 RepID=UPI0035242C24
MTAVFGLVLGFLATGVLPAQAAPAERASDGVGKAASVAAAEPTTWPAASRRYRVPHGSSLDCPSGYACTTTNDDSTGSWRFEFYSYGTYSLNNWFGQNGSVSNSQTGDAGMRLLDQNGKVLRCQWAGTGDIGINWDPVWYISLSATPC